MFGLMNNLICAKIAVVHDSRDTYTCKLTRLVRNDYGMK